MSNKTIKGLTVEIGADTTKLGKALEDVNKKSSALSSELGQINKLLKMDPGNTELLAQKQKVLGEAVSTTKEKLDTLKEAARQVQAQFERGEVSEEQVRALQREIVATTQKLKSYEGAVRETADELDKLGKETKETGKEMEDINKKSSALSSELGQINKLLKMDPGNTELLAQKQKVLGEAVSTTKEKLDTLKEAERQVQAQFERGEVSEEQVRALQREIVATTQKLKSYEGAVRETADELDKLGEETKETGKEMEDLDGKLETVAAGGMATVTAAITAIIGALTASAEASREYRREMGKLDTAYTDNGHTVEAAQKTYKELQSILGETDQAVEAANHMAKLTQNEQDLVTWTDIATGVYATFGASLPVEGLAEAANETAKVGKVTGPLADALNWAAKEGETFGITLRENIDFTELSQKALDGMTDAQRAEYEARKAQHEEIKAYNTAVAEAVSAEDKFNIALQNCTTEQERQQLIMNTLNGMYLSAAQTYKETNADVIAANEANEAWATSTAEVGEAVEPLLTKVKETGAELMRGLIPSINFMLNNLPSMAIAVSGITAALVTYKIAAIAAKAANEGMTLGTYLLTAAQKALNVVFLQNPIGIVILAVTALITALTLLWKNCEGFRIFWKSLWADIKGIAADSVAWLKQAGSDIGQFFVDMWSGLKTGAKDAWQGVKNAFGSVTTWFKDTFTQAWQKVKDVFSAGGKIFDGIKEGIERTFTSVVNALIRGINTIISKPFEAINWALSKIRDIQIAGLKPFDWVKTFDIPQIPELEKGGVLRKGQVGFLEGNGDEAVVPLERNTEWIDKLAQKLSAFLSDERNGLQFDGSRRRGSVSPSVLAFDHLDSKLEEILTAIERGHVLIIDGQTLVGTTAGMTDRALGQRRVLAERGAV